MKFSTIFTFVTKHPIILQVLGCKLLFNTTFSSFCKMLSTFCSTCIKFHKIPCINYLFAICDHKIYATSRETAIGPKNSQITRTSSKRVNPSKTRSQTFWRTNTLIFWLRIILFLLDHTFKDLRTLNAIYLFTYLR